MTHASAVALPAAEHHRLLAGTKLYWLTTEAHAYEQITQYGSVPVASIEATDAACFSCFS